MTTRSVGLSLMMLSTMAVSTLAFFALAVAASELQAEFGISKFQLGVLGAVNTGVGAFLAPASGAFSDKVGGGTPLPPHLPFRPSLQLRWRCLRTIRSSSLLALLVASPKA